MTNCKECGSGRGLHRRTVMSFASSDCGSPWMCRQHLAVMTGDVMHPWLAHNALLDADKMSPRLSPRRLNVWYTGCSWVQIPFGAFLSEILLHLGF